MFGGADPVDAKNSEESARGQIKNAFPDINDATLNHTISRAVMIKRGAFMGNLNMTNEGLSGGDISDDAVDHKMSDEILKQIFGDSDHLSSFKG